jgi:hypothetical protein
MDRFIQRHRVTVCLVIMLVFFILMRIFVFHA